MQPAEPASPWPELSYMDWEATKKTLQLYTQMAGKIRLALQPPRAEWMGSCLFPTARGLTTSPMPWRNLSVEVLFDFFDHTMAVQVSDGRERVITLLPARCIADIYTELMGHLAELGIEVDIWTKPQEVEDPTPLDENRHDCTYEPEQVQRFFQVITSTANVFNEWSSRFFGRSGVQFWWGSFDLSVLLFNGKHHKPPTDLGYIMRYDVDAEFLTAGFWPGVKYSPDPIFYAYINPQPPECSRAPVNPGSAEWVEKMGEWVLRYEDVRTSADPAKTLTDFLDCIYAIAGASGGWNLEDFKFTPPPPTER